jgi:L-asparaginase
LDFGLLVIQASRAMRGRVPDQRYNRVEGILGGGALTPGKLRSLAMLALHAGLPHAEIQRLLLAF